MSFEQLSPAILIAIFLAASAVVWRAGTRMSRYAVIVSDRTGLGGAFVGVALLGFATSLPEVATTVTASIGGDAQLAVNNLLGGVAFQVLVLAIADAAFGRKALTALVPSSKVMLQAVISILLLTVALLGIASGEPALGPIGAGSLAVGIAYLIGIWVMHRDSSGSWKPSNHEGAQPEAEKRNEITNRRLVLMTCFAASMILAAGYILTRSAEALAGAAGMGTDLVGLTLLAAATSLPEVSTAIAAVKLRQTEMAIGDVLGGNMFDTMLILLVDIVYVGSPVLRETEATARAAGLLCILLTSIMLLGLIERKDRTVFKIGYDSLAIIVCYVAGVAMITLRG